MYSIVYRYGKKLKTNDLYTIYKPHRFITNLCFFSCVYARALACVCVCVYISVQNNIRQKT